MDQQPFLDDSLVETLRAQALAIPELAAWPEMGQWLDNLLATRLGNAELCLRACQAVGGDARAASFGMLAIIFMEISIVLVDDMLDEDPRGYYVHMGVGRTANLALAFQAAALRILDQPAIDEERLARASMVLSQMALTTAFGQDLDVQDVDNEAGYWRIVRAKSAPFYGAALQIGALLGGADSDTAQDLYDLGLIVGEIVQINDDLIDALQTPACPDWRRTQGNLPIFYARRAQHPDRERFEELLPTIDDAEALHEAQQILFRCGAVSYCVYHLIERQRVIRQELDRLTLQDSTSLRILLTSHLLLLKKLSALSGVEIPVNLDADLS